MSLHALIYKFYTQDIRSSETFEHLREELNKIAFFSRTFNMFDNKTEQIYDVISQMIFVRVPNRTVIIREGDKKANEVFLLLKGSADVHINSLKDPKTYDISLI